MRTSAVLTRSQNSHRTMAVPDNSKGRALLRPALVAHARVSWGLRHIAHWGLLITVKAMALSLVARARVSWGPRHITHWGLLITVKFRPFSSPARDWQSLQRPLNVNNSKKIARWFWKLVKRWFQGLRHSDENGGTGSRPQRSQEFLQGSPIPKTENSAVLAHYFPENRGIILHCQKWGDASPCYGAPGWFIQFVTATESLVRLHRAKPEFMIRRKKWRRLTPPPPQQVAGISYAIVDGWHCPGAPLL